MLRGTFANIRLRNEMVPGTEGGWTTTTPGGAPVFIYDAAMLYKETGTPLVIIAGKEYGTGSSRDWAAKGTNLLGVRAVLAESFERIHRSNLVGMGVLPLQYPDGDNAGTYALDGTETFDIAGIATIEPRQDVTIRVTRTNGESFDLVARCRIDTYNELEYYRSGGILQYVLRNLAA
jgi:aconitate hydratase